MKKFQWLKITSGVAIFGFTCIGSYASISSCENNYVHCAYSVDKSNGLAGNYVKFSALGQSVVFCMPYGASASIDNTSIQQNNVPMGQNTWQFDVCSDDKCSNSVPVLTDTFNLSKVSEGQYKADPSTKSFGFYGHYPAVQCSMKAPAFPLKK